MMENNKKYFKRSVWKTSLPDVSGLPGISVIIIGLNVQRYIRKCISAVLESNYPVNLLEIIYVDSGSTDNSIEIARSFKVMTIQLNTDVPSAAKGRNAGLAAASNEVIQFIDADSFIHKEWFREAVLHLKKDIGAITGMLSERYPDRNWYHRMADLEWNLQKGKNGWSTGEMSVRTFGGNVLTRRSIILLAGGYDESMEAGEDPDLSYRVRNLSKTIYRINHPMASHDINMSSLSQYLTRTSRSGFAYAYLASKHWNSDNKYFRTIMLRILGGGLVPPAIIATGLLTGFFGPGLVMGAVVALRLVPKTGKFSRVLGIPRFLSFQYVLHLAVAVYPQAVGAIKFYFRSLVIGTMKKIRPVWSIERIHKKSTNKSVAESPATAG